ncbi:hypothetical protein XENTR_v10021753 [Xenopus tropicalis]|nr:hypothetical protein XENTR_v10021753 [Xenopus tropicalis]
MYLCPKKGKVNKAFFLCTINPCPQMAVNWLSVPVYSKVKLCTGTQHMELLVDGPSKGMRIFVFRHIHVHYWAIPGKQMNKKPVFPLH